MYPSGWKHYAWVKTTLRRTFVSLWKNCFSPFGRKNNHFFLWKQKFASEFFCPWHNVSTQKEHIYWQRKCCLAKYLNKQTKWRFEKYVRKNIQKSYIKTDSKRRILGYLHVLWQVSFGCWVTWSISRWKECYKSFFFPKYSDQ